MNLGNLAVRRMSYRDWDPPATRKVVLTSWHRCMSDFTAKQMTR
jgi:transcriptional regulator of acetoin/glycerol metabolism